MLVQVGKRYVSEQREVDPLFTKGMKELLTKSKVFKDCHEEFIRDLIVSCNRKEYPTNRYLMEEGARGDSMYVLYKGVVEVTANGRYICKLRDGSIVGEAALLNVDNRRTASVRSVQKCDVAIIFRSTFHSILEKYPWEKRKFQRELKAKMMELGKLLDIHDDINLEQQALQCEALRKVPFFARDEALHNFVAEVAMSATSFWYRPGRVIIQEGDTRCDEMYVLLKGAAEVWACGEFLGRIENDIFGEVCMLDLLERRTATVVAATQCQCMLLTRQLVVPLLSKFPDARIRLLEHARQRLVALNEAVCGDPQEPRSFDGIDDHPGCAMGFGGFVGTDDAQLFAACRLLQGASLDFLRDLSCRMVTQKVEEGKVIIQEGTPFLAERDHIYWVAKGQAEVWKGGNFVALLGEGDVFGELAAFGASAVRQATVRSKTRMVLRSVAGRVLKELFQRHDDCDLEERWEEEMKTRGERLAHKVQLRDRLKQHTTDIDFMFMQLPGLGKDGGSVPRNEPVSAALQAELLGWQAVQKSTPRLVLPAVLRQ